MEALTQKPTSSLALASGPLTLKAQEKKSINNPFNQPSAKVGGGDGDGCREKFAKRKTDVEKFHHLLIEAESFAIGLTPAFNGHSIEQQGALFWQNSSTSCGVLLKRPQSVSIEKHDFAG